MTTGKLLTTREASKYLGVHIKTLVSYITKGQLKAFKLGGDGKSNRRWRIKQEDLESFISGKPEEML